MWFQSVIKWLWSHDSAVHTVTRLQARQQWNLVLIPSRNKRFFSLPVSSLS